MVVSSSTLALPPVPTGPFTPQAYELGLCLVRALFPWSVLPTSLSRIYSHTMANADVKNATTGTTGTTMPDDNLVSTLSPGVEGKIIDLDERRLVAQGHKAELERSFSWLGGLALAFRSILSHHS